MPATPLPDVHVAEMEEVEDAALAMLAGMVRLLEAVSAGKVTSLHLAQTARLIRQLANTYRETPKVTRTRKEIEEDRRRLRKWTPTGYYLDMLKGGADEDDAA